MIKLLIASFIINTQLYAQDYGIFYSDALEAIINNNNIKLKYILNMSKEIYLNKENLLHQAIHISKNLNSSEIIKSLIESGADPYKLVDENNASQVAMSHALFDGNLKGIKFLLGCGVKISKEEYQMLESSFIFHANNKNYPILINLIGQYNI